MKWPEVRQGLLPPLPVTDGLQHSLGGGRGAGQDLHGGSGAPVQEVRVAARNTDFALVKTENGKSRKRTLSEEQRVIMRRLALLRHEDKFKNPSLPTTKKCETKHYWHIEPSWIIYRRIW